MDDFKYKLWDDYWRTYRISPEEAIEIPLQQIYYQISNIQLAIENNQLVYKIDIRTPLGMYKVKVDTITGKAIEVNEILY